MKIKPAFSEFKQMAQEGNLIPVYQEFLADTETPVSAYLKLKDDSYSYLLESAEGAKRWGRYSFIGCRPYLRAISRDSYMEIYEGHEKKVLKDVRNPLDVLRDLSAKFKPVSVKDLPPFQGGLVGFFNYDLVRKWEHLPNISPADRMHPEAIFIACRHLIIFDHFTHIIKVVAFAHLRKDAALKTTYDRSCQEVAQTIEKLQSPLPSVSKNGSFALSDLKPNFSKAGFDLSRWTQHL